jgi:hypothetical protein
MARLCISEISGYTMPRRQPRKAEHGVELVQEWPRASMRSTVTPIFFGEVEPAAPWCAGRNSCSGGIKVTNVMPAGKPFERAEDARERSRSRPGIPRPAAFASAETSSLTWRVLRRGSSRAWRRCDRRRRTCVRCGRDRCPRRRTPRRFSLVGLVGVGAHPSLRYLSAQLHDEVEVLVQLGARGPRSCHDKNRQEFGRRGLI